jgi:dCMP deaminase
VTRPTWDQVWLELAESMARRSRCPTGVAAVIVDQRQRVVSTGYAGPPAGFVLPLHDGTWDGSCKLYCPRMNKDRADHDPMYRDCPASHAEQAAISFADRSRTENGTIYVSSVPCMSCAKAVANSGVIRAVWRSTAADAYRDPETVIRFLDLCRLTVDVVS